MMNEKGSQYTKRDTGTRTRRKEGHVGRKKVFGSIDIGRWRIRLVRTLRSCASSTVAFVQVGAGMRGGPGEEVGTSECREEAWVGLST